MATPKSQRIGIWIIAIVMTIGTLGSFAVMVLANDNQQSSTTRLKELTTNYQNDIAAQTEKMSGQYFATFNAYASAPSAFEATGITDRTTKDLLVGDGDEITSGSTHYGVYYIGWNPTGKVFDQSISGGKLKAPFDPSQNAIEGMTKGVLGMKIGGVREITIPSAQAYGATGSGADIPANTPIKFIVMAVKFTQVQPSKELLDLYAASQQK